MIIIATVAAMAAVAALTYRAGRRVGLAACGLVTIAGITVAGLLGSRAMLGDIALGALLGIPVLIAAIAALDRKTRRAGSAPAETPVI